MTREIVIPLYTHTSDEEVNEILAELEKLQLALKPFVREYDKDGNIR